MRLPITFFTWTMAGTLLTGCAARPRLALPPPPSDPLYIVEVVGATVDQARSDGQPWDGLETSPPSALTLKTPLGTWSLSLTRAPNTQHGNLEAPDPVVSLSVGQRRIVTPPARDSFTPTWSYRFLVDPQVDGEGPVSITVEDDDGERGQGMGAVTLPLSELLSRTSHTLGPFGHVRTLTLTVTEVVKDQIPSLEAGPFQLAADHPDWLNTGVELMSGMFLAVAVDGRIRLSRFTTGYWGPNGVDDPQLNGRWRSRNLEGFEGVAHGAVVGCVVDPETQVVVERLHIGDGMLVRVSGSGLLLLGVNDRDSDNNAGVFRVQVGAGARMFRDALASSPAAARAGLR